MSTTPLKTGGVYASEKHQKVKIMLKAEIEMTRLGIPKQTQEQLIQAYREEYHHTPTSSNQALKAVT